MLRVFSRHQWVRIHGTPRVTVLAGTHVRRAYERWLGLAGFHASIFEGDTDFTSAMREAVELAGCRVSEPIAVAVGAEVLKKWRADRSDRLAALVEEGLVEAPDEEQRFDAKSAAEAALLEALEATPATEGRFRSNEHLSVMFGPQSAEVDLLDRDARIAIEIDGYYHFNDPESYRRDRRKDLLLQTQGLLVIRLLAEDVMRDPRPAVGMVCQALAYRRSGDDR